jgi:sporulation protein YlmC with PRC-barrel domain
MNQEIDNSALISASKVTGTDVYGATGERIGEVDDLIIHKISGEVIYAVMSFGGFLGIGEKLHPLPWDILQYDTARKSYLVPLEEKILKEGPAMTKEEIEALAVGEVGRTRIFDYYSPFGDW